MVRICCAIEILDVALNGSPVLIVTTQLPLTNGMPIRVQLDRIGLRPYHFDIGRDNEILLRLSYEFLKRLVEIQESTPLEVAPVFGTARGRRGRVLQN